jgi:predicted nucleotidyltransferase
MGWKTAARYASAVASFTGVIQAFNDVGVSYVIVGGLATVLHGHLRVTADVDFVISLDEPNVRKALDALTALGYRSRLPVDPNEFARSEVRQQWTKEKGMMVLSFFDPADIAQSVDLFSDYPADYGGLLARSVEKDLGTVRARICSLDDLIAIKTAAGRPIDREDVKALSEIRKHA